MYLTNDIFKKNVISYNKVFIKKNTEKVRGRHNVKFRLH